MKTTINIAAIGAILVFSLFSGFPFMQLQAKSPVINGPVKNTIELSLSALAPVTPKEATFSDVLPEKAPAMVSVAFVAPKEATFDDDYSSIEVSTELLKEVAPVTPVEADFNDATPEPDKNKETLIFRAPLEANFIDF